MSKSVSIFVGLMLGLAFGASLSYSGSSVLKGVLLLTEPLGLIWINAIRMTVIPLLVALLVTSIAGRRETGLVARIGLQTFGLFFFLVAISGLTALVVAPYLLQSIAISPDAVEILITSEAPNSERFQNLPNFKDWLVNLIPVNPIAAAAEGALLSLMIFTGLFSLALSSLKIEVKDTVISVFVGIKEAMLVLIGWVMAFAPIGVFSLVFSFSSSLGVSALAAWFHCCRSLSLDNGFSLYNCGSRWGCFVEKIRLFMSPGTGGGVQYTLFCRCAASYVYGNKVAWNLGGSFRCRAPTCDSVFEVRDSCGSNDGGIFYCDALRYRSRILSVVYSSSLYIVA